MNKVSRFVFICCDSFKVLSSGVIGLTNFCPLCVVTFLHQVRKKQLCFYYFTFCAVLHPTCLTRGQPATIIPRPARVIEILQGAYFPEVSHSALQ